MLWGSSLHRHYPTSSLSDPHPSTSCLLSAYLLRSPVHTRIVQNFDPRASGRPGCFYISVLLDAVCDPGVWTGTRPFAPVPVACILYHGLGLPIVLFRGLLPDSASHASPRNLSSTPLFRARFRRRVSCLTLSIVGWVPSYSLACTPNFDENTGWLTTPFPRGLSPP